jgi:hypothetical protein
MTKKVLLIGGSLNMTRMVHAVYQQLCDEFECHLTPFYTDGLYKLLADRTSLIDFTILGGNFRKQTDAYLRDNNLPIDYRGESLGNNYDLVVTTSDLYVPKNIRRKPFILIQEGMTDPENLVYHLVRALKLPRYLASTSTNGLSDQYCYFCVASDGYRDYFIRQKGLRPEKLIVTGIPNFDNCRSYNINNEFPYDGFVLVATSDARETYKFDNRTKFIQNALRIAGDRQIIFKLHPNENHERAAREISKLAPRALVYTYENIDHMIAKCAVLICQYSTVAYTGLVLGKEVYSYFDINLLKRLIPEQNGGISGQNIANVCRLVLGEKAVQPNQFRGNSNLQG